MKKLIIGATLIFSGITMVAQHHINTDLLGFALSRYGIGYEYAVNNQNSVGIYANFTSKNLLSDGRTIYGDLDNYSEMNIIPEYKWFATPNKGSDGIYFGVYGKYRTSNTTGNPYAGVDPNDALKLVSGFTDVKTSGFSLGPMFGYKYDPWGSIYFDFTAGVGKFLVSNVTYSDAIAENLTDEEFDEEEYIPYIGNALKVDFRLAFRVGWKIGGGNYKE